MLVSMSSTAQAEKGDEVKVKELLAALQDADPDAEVILQRDSEGNGYSPLSSADLDAVYIPDSTWSGDVYSMWWTADDACKSPAEWAQIVEMTRCVVLAPVN